MIISKILGDCAECGAKDSFGICMVARKWVIKGCRSCNHQIREDLPTPDKRVLYLDQCFLSSMFRRDDDRIVEAGRVINKLAHLQQVVTPFAGVHETESLQWIPDRRDELFKFIKQTARGHRFKMESEIKTVQMYRSVRQYLGASDTTVALEPSDALPRDLNDWDDYVWIDMKISLENPDETRKIKKEYAEQLVSMFPQWQGEDLQFKELVEKEAGGVARTLSSLLADTMSRWLSSDPSSFMFGSQDGAMMLQLLTLIQRETGRDDAMQVLAEYLRSAHFRAVPYISISSSLHAKLRQRVQQGWYSNLNKAKDTFMAFPYDVGFISVFGPYCDAMFVDNTMRQWLEENDMRFAERYRTRLFSKANAQELLDWLSGIESAIPKNLAAVAEEIYF